MFNDIGFSATRIVVREDVCTYIRTVGKVSTPQPSSKNSTQLMSGLRQRQGQQK